MEVFDMGKTHKLALNRETVRELSQDELSAALGQLSQGCITGWVGTMCSGSNCPPDPRQLVAKVTTLLATASCTCEPLV